MIVADCPDLHLSLCTGALFDKYVQKHLSDPKYHRVQKFASDESAGTPVLQQNKVITSPAKQNMAKPKGKEKLSK